MGLFGMGRKTESKGEIERITLSDGVARVIARKIDCLGDSCPRPQLMTKKALHEAASGDVIEVMVDNPSSMEAIPPMLPALGATHLETVKSDRRWDIYVRKD